MPIEYALENLENRSSYQEEILLALSCVVCLNLAKDPTQCSKCESLFCKECQVLLNFTGKGCPASCQGFVFEKANKFAREMLNTFNFQCMHCSSSKIEYSKLENHLKECNKDDEAYLKAKLIQELDQIEAEIEEAKKKNKPKAIAKTRMSALDLRKKMLTNNCPSQLKIDLYNSCMKGDLQRIKTILEVQGVNPFEEISAPSYFWTPIHYAFYYGNSAVIRYLVNMLKSRNLLEVGMRLETNDGRSPLLCLLRSNNLKQEQKKVVLTEFLSTAKIEFSESEMKELQGRKMTNILQNFGYR